MASAYKSLTANFFKFRFGISEITNMIQEIDLYFPYIVLFYGAVMSLVTSMPLLRERASESMNQELMDWFYGHRVLGLICLAVGFLWTLQRL